MFLHEINLQYKIKIYSERKRTHHVNTNRKKANVVALI